jgi:hypothetical protein
MAVVIADGVEQNQTLDSSSWLSLSGVILRVAELRIVGAWQS